MQVKSESEVAQSLATPWTAAYQAPPSMGFSRQEYRSGVPLLMVSQFLDTTNVGAKGRSGDAQPHPRALCHTLGNPVSVPPKLGPGGQVGGVCWVSYQTKGQDAS